MLSPWAGSTPIDSFDLTFLDGNSRRYLLATPEREAAAELLAICADLKLTLDVGVSGDLLAIDLDNLRPRLDAAVARAEGRPS